MSIQELIFVCSIIFSSVLNARGDPEGIQFRDDINANRVAIPSEESCDVRSEYRKTQLGNDSNRVETEESYHDKTYNIEAIVNRRDFRRLENRGEDRGARLIRLSSRSNGRHKRRKQKGRLRNKQDTGNHKEPVKQHRSSQNPLILTPYLKNNRRGAGIKASKVQPLIAGVKSYSGFFEVDEKKKSFMFFWFFYARNGPANDRHSDPHKTPVIVWLQGGLGHSSLHGALRINGPIHLEDNGTLTFNKYSWAEKAHLVYFDSLVGAGYSYTKQGGFSRNQDAVASNLYSALKQFLTLFHLAGNPLFITGQSYAGKSIVTLGAKIHKQMKTFHINFSGVAIGNGFIDPPNMLRYGAYLYQLGFIDVKQRDEFRRIRTSIGSLLQENKEAEARDMYADWIQGDLKRTRPPLIERIMGPGMADDYRQVKRRVNETELMNTFLNEHHTKKALNVGGIPYMNYNERAKMAIWPDLLKSQVKNLQLLLKGYRVLLYHGQMSVKYSYPIIFNYLVKMKWKGKRHFLNEYQPNELNSDLVNEYRNKWIVDGKMAGFFKVGGRLTELTVRNAGRLVPADQPKWAQRMIENFINNKRLNHV